MPKFGGSSVRRVILTASTNVVSGSPRSTFDRDDATGRIGVEACNCLAALDKLRDLPGSRGHLRTECEHRRSGADRQVCQSDADPTRIGARGPRLPHSNRFEAAYPLARERQGSPPDCRQMSACISLDPRRAHTARSVTRFNAVHSEGDSSAVTTAKGLQWRCGRAEPDHLNAERRTRARMRDGLVEPPSAAQRVDPRASSRPRLRTAAVRKLTGAEGRRGSRSDRGSARGLQVAAMVVAICRGDVSLIKCILALPGQSGCWNKLPINVDRIGDRRSTRA